ncbi:MAG: sulfotransferase family 2 domain-containing protein [Pseudomonadota bacterium]|nr:sulfotransferase family 2 domain-containing protein [Pseudomonadota bacterium]
MSQNVPIVFLHIPKCAGTSIAAAITEALGADKCYEYGKTEPYKRFESSAFSLDKNRFIAGHLTISQIELIRGPKKIFTVVRDPVERVLSWYEFLRRNKRTTLHPWTEVGDVHTFLERCCEARRGASIPRPMEVNSSELFDGMCRRLHPSATTEAALGMIQKHNILVLQQSKLDTQMQKIVDGLDLPDLRLPRLNVAPSKKKYPRSVTERIRELNREDLRLFEALQG